MDKEKIIETCSTNFFKMDNICRRYCNKVSPGDCLLKTKDKDSCIRSCIHYIKERIDNIKNG